MQGSFGKLMAEITNCFVDGELQRRMAAREKERRGDDQTRRDERHQGRDGPHDERSAPRRRSRSALWHICVGRNKHLFILDFRFWILDWRSVKLASEISDLRFQIEPFNPKIASSLI